MTLLNGDSYKQLHFELWDNVIKLLEAGNHSNVKAKALSILNAVHCTSYEPVNDCFACEECGLDCDKCHVVNNIGVCNIDIVSLYDLFYKELKSGSDVAIIIAKEIRDAWE